MDKLKWYIYKRFFLKRRFNDISQKFDIPTKAMAVYVSWNSLSPVGERNKRQILRWADRKYRILNKLNPFVQYYVDTSTDNRNRNTHS